MKKKSFLTFVLLCAAAQWAMAGNVTAEQALQQAQTFVNNRQATGGGPHHAPGTAKQLIAKGQVSGLYLFNVANDGGFVIVSNDDRTTPILGYSDSGSIDPDLMPDNMRAWLQGYADEIAWLQTQSAQNGQSAQSREPRRVGSHDTYPIGPLLTTTWNQRYPYNAFCPNGSVTGCVATAMAQVMYYTETHSENSTSATTEEIPSYIWKYNNTNYLLQAIPADSPLNWGDMLPDYSGGNSTDSQRNAVAALMKYCGYSVKMNYGSTSSAHISDVVYALRTYFGYAETTQYKSRSFYSFAYWTDLIYNELKEGRPVLYGGQSADNGHAFVCDGYQYENNTDLFHINWGWGGLSDGYYVLSVLNPDDQGAGGSSTNSAYDHGQDAVVGIKKIGDQGTVLDIPSNTINLTINRVTTALSTIAMGESVDVTINVTNNNSDDYDGDIFLAYDGTIGNGKTFQIPANTTKDCVVTFIPTQAREYSLTIAWPNGTGSYSGPNMNPVTINVINQTPTSLTATNITSETAAIGWTNVGEATKWNLRSRIVNISTEDFNEGDGGWEGSDQNQDGKTWQLDPSAGINNTPCFVSTSRINGEAINLNEWLISPQITFEGSFSFYAWGEGEQFQVMVSTNGTNFVTTWGTKTAINEPTLYTFDLSEYAGNGWIAIIHSGSSATASTSYLHIDDVSFTSYGLWTTVTGVTANPYHLTDMTKQTNYEVQVQPVINNGGKWSEPIMFTTTDAAFELADAGSNDELIAAWDGLTATVTLAGRTLKKNDKWNTLCLPFSLDATQLAASPLVGANIRALSSASFSGGVLTMNFTPDTGDGAITEIVAGTPYIIKWAAANSNIENPVFNNVRICKTPNNMEIDLGNGKSITFKGTYTKLCYTEDSPSILFLGENNTLWYPKNGATIGAQRAYFELTGITAGEATPVVRSITLNFGDEETGVVPMNDVQSQKDNIVYDLQGRRWSNDQIRKGLYIRNGRKVVIK